MRSFLERARRQSLNARIFWVLAALVLVAGPVALTLARDDDHTASVELFPMKVGPYPPPLSPAYYEPLLEDRILRFETRRASGLGELSGLFKDVEVTRTGRRKVTLSASAGTPFRARRFVNTLSRQLAVATVRELGTRATRDLREARTTLRRRSRTKAERKLLRRRLPAITRLSRAPVPRFALGAPASTPKLDRWADRLVDGLPGSVPARPSPVWAGLAGLLLAATAWGIVLAFTRPRPPG